MPTRASSKLLFLAEEGLIPATKQDFGSPVLPTGAPAIPAPQQSTQPQHHELCNCLSRKITLLRLLLVFAITLAIAAITVETFLIIKKHQTITL